MLRFAPYVLALAVWLLATPAGASVLKSPSSSGSSQFTASPSSPISYTASIAGNYVVVAVTASCTGASVPLGTISGVTFGGQAMTQLATILHASTDAKVELWGLLLPPQGAQTVQISFTGFSGSYDFLSGYQAYGGVDQTTPTQNATTATGTSTTASVTITSAAGDYTVAAVASANLSAPSAPTQTSIWTRAAPAVGAGAMSDAVGSASVTHQWTVGSDNWAMAGVSLKAAPPIVGCILNQDGGKLLAQNGTGGVLLQGGSLSACVATGKGFPFYNDPFYPMIVR